MGIEFDAAREYASLCGSVIALVSTFYFWLVRANREKARLEIHPIADMEGCLILGHEDPATYQRLRPGDQEHCVRYWLHLAVVNNSSLPNAVLGVRVWLQRESGQWQKMDIRHQMPDEDLLPINVNPLTTSSMKLSLAMLYSGDIQNDFAGRAAAAGDALPREIPVRVELTGLNQQQFCRTFTDGGNNLKRSLKSVRLNAA
ncbi:hypothetical protein [Planctomycetes bacterium K23_9]|uniref:Uncharacterized protein n=1 Tax=Stieleria marina TaxID=1930275 RepID=A0A517NNB3_9BACT|nr:hypothetical protein K239x_05550 [Planctomycetes bacterium K23_9]